MDENRDCSHLATKKIILLFTLILIGFALFILFCENAKADTITVDDDGGADYMSIQVAIDNANIGDTIYVKPGWYSEIIVINKTINLIGENSKDTYVYGNGVNSTILVESDYVNISYFRISWNRVSINLTHANYCNISNRFLTATP